ncbi:MAG: SprB repeat-containing protein, partial [Flavobacteriales bacterium]|nr:SprB repeat-containing protein [Flavobacteriales bacterium]
MKKAGFIFSIMLTAILISGQAQSQSMFQKVIGGAAGDEKMNYSQMTADSGQIMVGTSDGFGGGAGDVYLVKTDANGDLEWSKTYGGFGADSGQFVQPTFDGGYIVVGETQSSGQGLEDYFLIKTDSVGDTLWTKTYGGAAVDVSYCVRQTFDSGYVMVGYTGSYGTGAEDIYVIKTDPQGDTLWTKTYGTGGYDYAYSILQTSDSGYVLTGETYQAGGGDLLLMKLDAMGDTVWTKTYGKGVNEGGWALQATMDGGYVIAGWSNSVGAGNYDVFVVKTDSMGDTLWTGLYGGTGRDVGLSILETSDTTYLISGFTFSFGVNNGDAYAFALNSTGTLLWSKAYGGSSGDLASSFEPNAGGGYIIGGYSFSLSGGDADFYLLHTDSSGSTGLCYENTVATVSTSASWTKGTLNVTSAMNSVVGAAGTTVTSPSDTSRIAYSVAITASTNDTCNGEGQGTATVLVTGGVPPFIYAWSDPTTQSSATADSLMAGTYQVIVTDASGCVDSASVTLTEPPAIVVVISDSTHLACNGDANGSATVSASGGVGPLSYLWNDPSSQTDSTMTGVGGGAYMCTVTDSTGCSKAISFTVIEPAAISLSTVATLAAICNSDSSATVTATVSGGNGPMSYLWNDAGAQTTAIATGIPDGSYIVVVTDSAGCSVTDTVTFGIMATISTSASPVCGGVCDGTASVLVTGNAGPVTYLWDNPASQTTVTASSLCSGSTYTTSVTDSSGCTSSASVTFSALTQLTVTITIVDVKCFGDSNGTATAIVSGGATPYGYLWPSLGLTTNFASVLKTGAYDVIVTDGNGCTMVVTGTVFEPSAALSSSLIVTPVNCFGGSDGSIDLTVTGGTVPYAYDWPTSVKQDTSGLATGIYEVDITDANGCMTSDTATITQSTSMIVSSGSTPALVGDSTGSAWVIVTGGTAPYTYVWNDGLSQTDSLATSLASGEYSVVVSDSKGCTVTMEIAVGDFSVGVFEASFEGAADDLARDIDLLTGGGHIMAGVTESFGAGGSDMFLVNADENGNFNWAKAYGGTGDDGANAVLETSDGGYIMVGYTSSFGPGSRDMYVVKTDVNGVIEWTQSYGGAGEESAYSVAEVSSGYVIAGGTNSFGAGNTDVYVISIDDNGVVQWTKTYGGSDYDYGYDIKATADGGFIVAGYTNSFGAGGADAYLIKITATGTSSWTKVMGGNLDEAAWSVIETTNGYAFTGNTESFGSGQQDVYFVLTDATGTPTLTTAFGGTQLDYGNDLVSTADGGYAIAGYTQSFNNFGDEVYIIKTDGAGEIIWSRTYGG